MRWAWNSQSPEPHRMIALTAAADQMRTQGKWIVW